MTIEGIVAGETLRVTSLEGSILSNAGAIVSSIDDTSFIVNRDGNDIDLGQSTNTFGNLSLIGKNIVVSETSSTNLVLVDADSLDLNSGGDITNSDQAAINTILLAALTAAGDIVLGDGVADSVNFGRLALTATNADVIESSGTLLAVLDISENLNLTSENSMIGWRRRCT